jgi:hypothetical protein
MLMKNTLIIGFFLAFMLSFSMANALTINAQPQTTCDNAGYCKTEVNMTPYLTTKEISDVKLSDYTKMIYATTYNKTMLAKPKEANTFNVSYNGSTIKISGYVSAGTFNYWTFNLTKDVIIDPWWNYTNSYLSLALPICNKNDYADNSQIGFEFMVLQNNIILINATKNTSSDATYARLYLSSGVNIGNFSFSGNTINFNNISLINGQSYYLVADKNGASHTHIYKQNAWGSVYSDTRINATNGAYYSGAAWTEDTSYRIFLNIVTGVATSIFYNSTLLLNGNATNLTLDNSTALNVTALANLTGLNISLFRNGTLTNFGLNNVTNISNLSAGLYNITGFFGNTSTNETLTLWANMTFTLPTPPINYTSPYPANTSWDYCANNLTLLSHDAIYNNGTFAYANDTYTICPNGCDNTTFSCKLEPMQEGFVAFGFIIVFFIILLFFDRYILRGRR